TEHVAQLPPVNWGQKVWTLLVLSIFVWTGIIFLGATIWKIILAGLGHYLSWQNCLMIYGFSQLGKYLPGNFGHIAGRAVLAKRVGVPVTATAQAMILEVAWSMGVAASIALCGLLLGRDMEDTKWLLLLIVAGAFLAPWTGVALSNRFFSGLVFRLTGVSRLSSPSLIRMCIGCILYILTFLVVGLLLDFHASVFFGADVSHVFLATVFFAWSWIAGYITPGAPAGLGVREAVLVSTLTPLYGAGVAVGVTISLRLITTLGDGLAFFVALLIRSLYKGSVSIEQPERKL
ncbi:MAG: hypothetical protein EP324_00105, partial [Gammaproteobacteria bacterium]